MSWSGFKKNVGRATTQVMMKTGHVEKTSDRDYEVEERRYRTLESASLRLQKEAKGYLDSLRAMTASQMRIAETIDAFYGESGAKDGVSRSYKQAVEDLDAETVKALDGPYRCVTRDPKIVALVKDNKDTYPQGVLDEIEDDLNFKRRDRNYTQGVFQAQQESLELIEYVYRTTVLEPINRFCAYFPDINECIKKRNHKMLDYDSMRSKVKKLTEKPDKDPSKLPRTEKETEMVMNEAFTFYHKDAPSDDLFTVPTGDELMVLPSPPKALDGLKHKAKMDLLARIKADEDAALHSIGMKHRITKIARVASHVHNAFWGLPSPNGGSRPLPPFSSPSSGKNRAASLVGSIGASSTDASPTPSSFLAVRGGGMIPPVSPHTTHSPTFPSFRDNKPEETPTRKNALEVPPSSISPRSSSHGWSAFHKGKKSGGSPGGSLRSESAASSRKTSNARLQTGLESGLLQLGVAAATARPVRSRTPFFHPSELEEIMAPMKLEFLARQANQLEQAKAAYLQLNEQLTNELPQLIDLRVPYLDPSFEALVKIQLRFCAEAYSRMAQVQQYLDASTRDQYANGDLDARVEDVLGQIRELSIAGTV